MSSHHRSHPLLEQVPLTVSPFVSLPTATTLSYNYKTLPSNIPPSALGIPNADTSPSDPSAQPKPRYVVSSSGHAAHPDDITASCKALQRHISKLQEDADRELKAFQGRIEERELAERRRVAPGWLDSDARLLEPERKREGKEVEDLMDREDEEGKGHGPLDTAEGAELDRAFGGMALRGSR